MANDIGQRGTEEVAGGSQEEGEGAGEGDAGDGEVEAGEQQEVGDLSEGQAGCRCL